MESNTFPLICAHLLADFSVINYDIRTVEVLGRELFYCTVWGIIARKTLERIFHGCLFPEYFKLR